MPLTFFFCSSVQTVERPAQGLLDPDARIQIVGAVRRFLHTVSRDRPPDDRRCVGEISHPGLDDPDQRAPEGTADRAECVEQAHPAMLDEGAPVLPLEGLDRVAVALIRLRRGSDIADDRQKVEDHFAHLAAAQEAREPALPVVGIPCQVGDSRLGLDHARARGIVREGEHHPFGNNADFRVRRRIADRGEVAPVFRREVHLKPRALGEPVEARDFFRGEFGEHRLRAIAGIEEGKGLGLLIRPLPHVEVPLGACQIGKLSVGIPHRLGRRQPLCDGRGPGDAPGGVWIDEEPVRRIGFAGGVELAGHRIQRRPGWRQERRPRGARPVDERVGHGDLRMVWIAGFATKKTPPGGGAGQRIRVEATQYDGNRVPSSNSYRKW